MSSKTICLDFDGVIHQYNSGWKGIDVIPDEPVDGSLGYIIDLVQAAELHSYLRPENRNDIDDPDRKRFYEEIDNETPDSGYWWLSRYPKYEVSIYSSRSSEPKGIEAMQIWLLHHLWNYLNDQKKARRIVYESIKWPTTKPPAFLTIDDRAVTFTGTFPSFDSIDNFKPWNK